MEELNEGLGKGPRKDGPSPTQTAWKATEKKQDGTQTNRPGHQRSPKKGKGRVGCERESTSVKTPIRKVGSLQVREGGKGERHARLSERPLEKELRPSAGLVIAPSKTDYKSGVKRNCSAEAGVKGVLSGALCIRKGSRGRRGEKFGKEETIRGKPSRTGDKAARSITKGRSRRGAIHNHWTQPSKTTKGGQGGAEKRGREGPEA